jgi:hypothetical protein
MRQIALYISLMLLFISCKKDTTYQLSILIKNVSDNDIFITLYPKSEFMSGDLYDYCSFGGGYRDTTIEIGSNEEAELYISDNLQIKPYELAKQVFDSIHIKVLNEHATIIKFTQDTVINYPNNLFDNNSYWIYEKRDFDLPTNFSTHYVVSNDYFFEISQ